MQDCKESIEKICGIVELMNASLLIEWRNDVQIKVTNDRELWSINDAAIFDKRVVEH